MSRAKPVPADMIDPDADDELRLRHERLRIGEARASVTLGAVVPDDDVNAWLDHMVESDAPMPIPEERGSNRGPR